MKKDRDPLKTFTDWLIVGFLWLIAIILMIVCFG